MGLQNSYLELPVSEFRILCVTFDVRRSYCKLSAALHALLSIQRKHPAGFKVASAAKAHQKFDALQGEYDVEASASSQLVDYFPPGAPGK